MMANNSDSQRRKRGRPTDKLCVRLFLLDPDNKVTKVTKETCSKKGLTQLKEKGCGPPNQKFCTNDDAEKVEFSFDLSSEQFKQKLVEIYPQLENAFFMFMKADKNNVLVELNPGICCYRCYTPENVYNSERGQGRLYIQVIAENEISPCNHGAKRWRSTGGSGNFIHILPKPGPESISATTETGKNVVAPVTAPAENESTAPALDLSSLPIVLAPQPAQNSGKIGQLSMNFPIGASQSFLNVGATHRPLTSSTVSTQMAAPLSHSSGHMTSQNNLTLSVLAPWLLSQSVASMPSIISPISTTQAINSSSYLQNKLPVSSTVASWTVPRQSMNSLLNVPSTSTAVSQSLLQPSSNSSVNIVPQGQLHTTQTEDLLRLLDTNVEQTLIGPSSQITGRGEQELGSELRAILNGIGRFPIASGNLNKNLIPPGYTVPNGEASNTLDDLNTNGAASFNQLSTLPPSDRTGPSPALDVLALVSEVEREQHIDNAARRLLEQGPVDITEPEEFSAVEFLENVETTKKLEISLEILGNNALLKKLEESTITIDIVSIQSSCKVLQVLRNYSLPSCLKILKINGNSLNLEEISQLVTSLCSVKNLKELHLYGTKFLESSIFAFICVLNKCKGVASLTLTDNGLTKQEISGLTTAFESMENLKTLNLSKSNFTATQANEILKKLAQAKSIVSLDLSQNALQGIEIVTGICKLQSLEELDLSHNCIKFSPLPDLDEACDSLSTNMKSILLSANHMTAEDISQFCSLIRSDLLKLNLDANHVGSSIWSLCSLGSKIKRLKVLSLANTDICLAVDGLAFLLSLVGGLEELNLSSNNLMFADFEKIQSPMSKLTDMKRLNLSRNYVGVDWIEVLSDMLKEFPSLESLDISESFIKEHDISVLCNSLLALKELRYLNLSGNRIDVEVLEDAFSLPSTLEELSLSDVIHGEKLFQNWEGLLPKLKRLHLSNLKLRPCDVEVLADMLLSCSMLEELYLPSVDIAVPYGSCERLFDSIRNIKKIDLTGIKVPDERTLAGMIKSFSFLDELVLADMKAANSDSLSLCCAIKLLKRLRKLDLGDVRVRDVKAFFDMLSLLSDLEELAFPDLVMSEDDNIIEDVRGLESLSCLKILDLRHKIHKPLLEALGQVLPSMHLLEKLTLRAFEFGDNEWEKQLFVAVEKLKYLKQFDVHIINYIDDTVIAALAQALSSMQFLVKLVLELPDDTCDEKLLNALEKLGHLKELTLSCSKVTEPGLETLIHVLPALEMLEKLELCFEVEKCNELCVAIGELKYLKKLTLAVDLCDADIEYVFNMLCKLSLLEELRISDDGDSDSKELFTAIANLKYLKKLFISYWCNEMHTQAFAKVASLRMLEELEGQFDLGECDEESFTHLRKLKYLKKLSFHLTSGSMPYLHRVLASFQMLEELKIWCADDNQNETAGLTAPLGKLKHLKVLELKYIIDGDLVIWEALTEALSSLYLLEKLELALVRIKGIELVFPFLRNMKYLKELVIVSIEACGEAGNVKVAAEMIPSLLLLESLDITGNWTNLIVPLSKLKYLKKFSCEQNSENVERALTLTLPSLHLLEELSLPIDFFTNSNNLQLLTALRSACFLTTLRINEGHILQTDATTLLTTLLELKNLKVIRLPKIVGIEEKTLTEKKIKDLRCVHGMSLVVSFV